MSNETLQLINLETTHCPQCCERMPYLRLPDNLQQLMWGGWTCPQCGCRTDRFGKAIVPAATEGRSV